MFWSTARYDKGYLLNSFMRTMSSRIGISALAVAAFLAPLVASAASITDTLLLASSVLNALIGLSITAAIVVFFYGMIRYMISPDAGKKSEGMKMAIYGVVTIFIMVSIWGIIRLLQSTFKVTSTDPIIPRGVVITPTSY